MLSYHVVKKISKGYSSDIFLVSIRGKNFVLKREKSKSRRIFMVEKEAKFLQKANEHGIGPVLFAFDVIKRELILEHVRGCTFREWLLEKKPGKRQLEKVIALLREQARELDALGVDHGQLGGAGKNILIRFSPLQPVIIDFEKASDARKVHNVSVLENFLFSSPHSAIQKKIAELLRN